MKKLIYLIVFFIFSLILAACDSLAPQPSPEDEQAHLATMVAATVEAALDSPLDGEPAPADEDPVATPESDALAAPEPVFYPPSPNLRVAYIKDGNVYVWTEGGSSIGLTSTGDAREVRISSDGQRIAYVREFGGASFDYELWVVNADGGVLNPQLLVSQTEMSTLKGTSQFPDAVGLDFDQIEWRPGTHNLYYSTVPRFMGPGYAPSYDVRMVNTDTLAKSTLFNFGQGGAFTFSPDGGQIVLSTPDHISLCNADGSNLRASILTFPLVATYSEYQYHPSPIWAADSNSLRVAIPPEDPFAEPAQPTALWFLPVDGSSPTQLGSMPAISFDWPDRAFSPDMSFIAYVMSVGEPTDNQRELHIAFADGSNDIVVATGTSLQFRGWAPDSTRFLYALNSVDDSGLYLGGIDGSVFTISSVHQTMGYVDWIDNDRIIFIYENPTTSANELRISHQGGTNHAFIDTLSNESFTSFDFTP